MSTCTHKIRPTVVVLLPLFLVACGEDPPEGFYNEQDAVTVAREITTAWAKGDVATVQRFVRPPFLFGRRTWQTAELIKANLPGQVGDQRLKDAAGRLDKFEAFSHWTLMKGKWPRKRKVPEADRPKELERLGVLEGGFLVRVFAERGRSWLLILNPGMTDHLVLQGLLP